MPLTRRPLLLLHALLLAWPALAQALPPGVHDRAGVALHGFDTVAWHFVSAGNLARFQAQPAALAPAFGGFCAFGVARGYKMDFDSESWHIHAGRLYLKHDRGVQRRWLRDMPGYIAAAEANWPRLMAS